MLVIVIILEPMYPFQGAAGRHPALGLPRPVFLHPNALIIRAMARIVNPAFSFDIAPGLLFRPAPLGRLSLKITVENEPALLSHYCMDSKGGTKMRRRWTVCVLSVLLAIGGGWCLAAAGPDKTEFPLKEVSVYQAGIEIMQVGEQTVCTSASQMQAASAPRLKSARALQGMVMLNRDAKAPASEVRMNFVIDESQGTGKGYDRLLLDLDHDGNFTKDKPVAALKEAPAGGIPQGYPPQYQFIFFEPLELTLDGAPGADARPVKVQPRLMSLPQYQLLTLVPVTVRQGEIEYGGKRYLATLVPQRALTARYDSPQMGINLAPAGNPTQREYWWGADQLNALRPAGGKWYQMSTTPSGDRLIVSAYQGDMGVFKAGTGARKIASAVTLNGSLSSISSAVPVGEMADNSPMAKPVSEMRLPVGDYLPALLNVKMGGLSIEISDNYHLDGQPRGRTSSAQGRPYKIAIRKDQPFVLDFSNQPEVMFASPARNGRIRPGETLQVAAVLTDPKLEVMIRGLTDNDQKTSKEYDLGNGRKQTVQQPTSLDPKVVITRGNGERVAEGVMPFG